jgi:putative transposase
VSDAKHLKQLEAENAKLKKLPAEAMLDVAVLKDIHVKKVVTPAARRAAVRSAREAHEISERRACSIIGADRSAVRYPASVRSLG